MTDTKVQVEGLDELRAKLKKAAGSTKDLRAAHRKVGKQAESMAKAEAATGTKQQSRAAKALLGKGSNFEAQIGIRNLGSVPFGIGAFMGALAWKQFPEWVGSSWQLGTGDGPYVLRDAFNAQGIDDIKGTYLRELVAQFEAAGLDVQ